MQNKYIVPEVLLAVVLLAAGCSAITLHDDPNDIVGMYQLDSGSSLQIIKGGSANEYRLSAIDIGDFRWTSVGFYDPGCLCIEAVFQYDSHKEQYGGDVGVHRFTYRDNYSEVVKSGGWNKTNEFAEQLYVRR